jgi:hypothetical protein
MALCIDGFPVARTTRKSINIVQQLTLNSKVTAEQR